MQEEKDKMNVFPISQVSEKTERKNPDIQQKLQEVRQK